MPGFIFSNNPICPRHPGLLREVIKRLLAKQHHGNFTPPRFSPSCPHLLRRFFHARPYGGTGVSPHCISSPHRVQSGFVACLFLARCGNWLTGESFVPCSFNRNITAQPLLWLMLLTKAMGMCLMNGYSVFNVQPCSPPKSGKQVRGKLPSHLFPH